MRFVDPIQVDRFEVWLKEKMDEYERVDQVQYSLVIRDVLRQYRNFKSNEVDTLKSEKGELYGSQS